MTARFSKAQVGRKKAEEERRGEEERGA